MAYYTPPDVNDTKGFVEIFSYINTVSGGIFFPLFMLAVFIITFIAMKGYRASRAWTIASFISAVLTIPLTILNMVAPRYMYISIICVAIGAVWMKFEDSV